jgi:hypothetical protein
LWRNSHCYLPLFGVHLIVDLLCFVEQYLFYVPWNLCVCGCYGFWYSILSRLLLWVVWSF